MTQSTEHRSFGSPDEVRAFPNGRAEILKVGGFAIKIDVPVILKLT